MTTLGAVAMVYMVLSRLAYVVGVGIGLKRQDRNQAFTRERGIDEGFRRFKRGASWVMNNDAAALVLVCVTTRGTLPAGVARDVLIVVGVAFIAIGGGVKAWARDTLGVKAYYWYNFFNPAPIKPLERPGPYRYLDNPMYTVGYLPAYGVAMVLASWPGMVAAAFAQLAIVGFHLIVEKPHFDRLKRVGGR